MPSASWGKYVKDPTILPFSGEYLLLGYLGQFDYLSHHALRRLYGEAYVDLLGNNTSWAQSLRSPRLSHKKVNKEASRWFQHLAIWDTPSHLWFLSQDPNIIEQRHTISAVFLLNSSPTECGSILKWHLFYTNRSRVVCFATIDDQNKELLKTPKKPEKPNWCLMLHPQIHIQLACSGPWASAFFKKLPV